MFAILGTIYSLESSRRRRFRHNTISKGVTKNGKTWEKSIQEVLKKVPTKLQSPVENNPKR